ncbi:MAG: DsbA family protein [Candidatus Woesearchaeota archaeon]
MVKKHGFKGENNALIWQIGTAVFAVLFIVSIFTGGFNFLKNSSEDDTQNSATGFTVVVLNDNRCSDCIDFANQIAVQLKSIFPNMEVEEIDYSTKEGKKLYEESGLTALPAFLFDEEAKTQDAYSEIERYLIVQGNYNSLMIGAEFDPTSEICTNGVDDTGNGLIDCEDSTCSEKLECREEIKNNLQVFIMSDCPYGKEAIKALAPVLEAMPELTYDINYIVSDMGDGTFRSLHGDYEVEEDIRQLCALNQDKDKFFAYTLCRSENGVNNVDWNDCAVEAELDKTALEECVTGDLGKELLSENSKIAESLGIGASPTWIANNRYQFGGITSDVVQSNICQYNIDLEGCDAVVSSESAVPAGQC